MVHIISWSGGKDSTATVILFHLHHNELMKAGDRVIIIFSEVMFDLKQGISGHNPDVIKFVHDTAEIFRSWGYEVQFLHAGTDFLGFFHHKIKKAKKHPSHEGLTYGFPASGICGVKRDLKLKPIEAFKKILRGIEHMDYIGIAKNEPNRLASLHKSPNTVSLLEKYGYTEDDARSLCMEFKMLSPQYSLNMGEQKRDGCWFCPNAKICEHRAIFRAYPEAWATYVALEDEPNLAYGKWTAFSQETLHERDAKVRYDIDRQYTIFDLFGDEI